MSSIFRYPTLNPTALLLFCFLLTVSLASGQHQYVSKVWNPDLGNGRYKNPIIYADYSDPDVCREGDNYYMTASSFNAIPGLPILHSRDMINWTLINHAIPELYAAGIAPHDFFDRPQHGNGVWAPSIRYHKGEFYIYYGDPDFGIFMTKTRDPKGRWEPLVLVKEGKGLIDACPFWDEDGEAYIVHAYAGSRAGIKSVIAVSRMTSDGKATIGSSRIVYDGHELDPTIEGAKFHKRNGYYYIFAPAGGVATGWQTVLRSKDIFGPYERKIVIAQGSSTVNGPHQGAWVETAEGEDWFYHFQDVGPIGRIVHLQPMVWKNDWPIIGEDNDGDGCGQPVAEFRKPRINQTYPMSNPIESDDFNSNTLGLQWQWHANPTDWWYFANAQKGVLSLFSVPVPEGYKNLWDISNLLLQKIPAPEMTATTKVTLYPDPKIKGERTGLLLMGMDYALLSFESVDDGFLLSQNVCMKADGGGEEKTNDQVKLKSNTIYLQIKLEAEGRATFLYSTDGDQFVLFGEPFMIKEGKWIGAKIGIFCTRPIIKQNDGGWAEFDWFRIN